jgi:hypothetical protein
MARLSLRLQRYACPMKTNPLQSHLKALGIGMAAACAVAASPAVLAAEPTASACTDFYAHINGQWINSTELPADRARIGSFDQLAISNTRLLIRALDKLLAEPQQQNTPGLKLLATWYGSALDPATAKAAGLRPAQPLLQRIDGLKDRAELPALLAEFTRHRLGGPLGMSVMADNQDVRRHIVGIGGSGIGLPDRDDYLKTDATSKRLQDAYRAYARQLLQLAGAAHDDASLDALMAFEKQLAESMLTGAPQPASHQPPPHLAVPAGRSAWLGLDGLGARIGRHTRATAERPGPDAAPAASRAGHRAPCARRTPGHLADLSARAPVGRPVAMAGRALPDGLLRLEGARAAWPDQGQSATGAAHQPDRRAHWVGAAGANAG